jgi:periplasmic divalent cation tolerance protein
VQQVVVVTVTTPDERLAGELARVLVDERLAACAQVGGPIGSTYRWDGEVQVDAEWLVTLKTVESRVAELASRVQDLHPYEVPEVVAVPAVGGSEAYLEWVRAESG